MKKVLRIVLLLAVIGGVTAWLVTSGRLGHSEPKNQLALYGNVDIRQVELGFRVAGRLAALKLDEGEAVKAGALLAELDRRSYEDEVKAAEALVAQQAANVDKLERGPRKDEIAQGRAALAERKASLENAKLALARMQKLRADEVVPQSNLDDALAARDAAQARVQAASAALRLLDEGSRSEDIAGARAALDVARARLAAAHTALADTSLLAPADGVVLSRVREPGAIVGPSDIVYVVSLTRPVWVRAYVDEPQLGRIHPGMEVTVVTDSAPGKPYRGRVGFISPVAEFTPKSVETPDLRTDLVYRLRVIVDQPDDGLRQGMPVTVHVPVAAPREG